MENKIKNFRSGDGSNLQNVTNAFERPHSTSDVAFGSSSIPRADADKKSSKTSADDKILKKLTSKGLRYRDFSRVQSIDPDRVASIFKPSSKADSPFPIKLHAILSTTGLECVISWLPHGRSWRILRPEFFEERVLPVYFKHRRLSSFMRQVNGWGFIRVKQGPDYNSYYNELFLRGLPHLVTRMRRTGAISKVKNLLETDDGAALDFYKISEKNPVPGCRSASTKQRDQKGIETFGPANNVSSVLERQRESIKQTFGTLSLPYGSHQNNTSVDAHASNVQPRGTIHPQHKPSLLNTSLQGPSFHRLDVPVAGMAASLDHSRLDLARSLLPVIPNQPQGASPKDSDRILEGNTLDRHLGTKHKAKSFCLSDNFDSGRGACMAQLGDHEPRLSESLVPLANQLSELTEDNLGLPKRARSLSPSDFYGPRPAASTLRLRDQVLRLSASPLPLANQLQEVKGGLAHRNLGLTCQSRTSNSFHTWSRASFGPGVGYITRRSPSPVPVANHIARQAEAGAECTLGSTHEVRSFSRADQFDPWPLTSFLRREDLVQHLRASPLALASEESLPPADENPLPRVGQLSLNEESAAEAQFSLIRRWSPSEENSDTK